MIHSEMAQSYFVWWSPHLECGHLWKRHVPASSSKAQRKEWKECSVPTVNTLSSWNRHPLNSSPRGDAIWLRSVSPWIPRVTESPWDPVYVHYTYSNNAPGQPTIENNGSTLYYYPHFTFVLISVRKDRRFELSSAKPFWKCRKPIASSFWKRNGGQRWEEEEPAKSVEPKFWFDFSNLG